MLSLAAIVRLRLALFPLTPPCLFSLPVVAREASCVPRPRSRTRFAVWQAPGMPPGRCLGFALHRRLYIRI